MDDSKRLESEKRYGSRFLKSIIRSVLVVAIAWISLLCPSWQILVSSSLPLYLNNQEDLYHNIRVIYPFLSMAVLLATLALPLYFAALRVRILSSILWLYYTVGFAFLGAISIQELQMGFVAGWAASIALVVAFVVVQIVANRWWDLRRATAYFALFATCFVTVDAYEFASRYVELPEELVATAPGADRNADSGVTNRPNFYHIVLDEYQTDLFEFTLDSELEEALGGFVFFADAVTVFGRTAMSLASVFGGRSYDFSSPQVEYQKSAFAGPQSMLTQLVDTEYLTEAYLHERMFGFPLPFHMIRFHSAPTGQSQIVSNDTFRDLWVYANFPTYLSDSFIQSDRFANFEAQNVLDPSTPIKSLHSFDYLMRREASQSGTGRYVFAHLILPHSPNVLDSNCSYSPDGSKTGAARQAGCANALMARFVTTLRRLGRFQDSLIVIQSDHGSRYAIRDGRPFPVKGLREYGNEWNTARSRSLLLIKLPARDAKEPLHRNSLPASLLDVFPTVAAALKLDPGEADGVDLFDASDLATLADRQRWYYFFEKKERSGWTDEMVRFRVEDRRVVRNGVQILTNNPRS